MAPCHVNRGIAYGTVFKNRACVWYFLAKLESMAKVGDVEMHVFVVLTTHFHPLARRPEEKLSNAMQRVQHPSMDSDPLADLAGAAPENVQRWMRHKAASPTERASDCPA